MNNDTKALDMAICRKVYEARALTLPALFRAFPEVGEWRLRRAVDRLQRRGLVIIRKVSKSGRRGPRTRYLVLGQKGLRLFGETDSSHKYREARRAERILYSNEIAEKFLEAGLPREMLMSRSLALEALKLPSAMTALDWVISSPYGLYTVHARVPRNGGILLRTIQRAAQVDGVRGHIVVCANKATVTRVRRKYELIARRFGAKHFFIISVDRSDDFSDIVDHIMEPRAWRNQICLAFYSHFPANIKYSAPSEDEQGPIACRIEHEKLGVWMAGDLRTWDVALASAARQWDPKSALAEHGTDKIVLLTRDYRQAKAKAMSLGLREHIWWALAKASSGRSLFCVRTGNLVTPDFAAEDGGKS